MMTSSTMKMVTNTNFKPIDMNTTENNKMIAEFMGNKPFAKDNFGNDLYNNPMNEIKFSHKNPTDMCDYEFEYHTSWDWLMPVVERCYDNGAEGEEIGDITHALLDCDIKSTYIAVVQFINQYNNQ